MTRKLKSSDTPTAEALTSGGFFRTMPYDTPITGLLPPFWLYSRLQHPMSRTLVSILVPTVQIQGEVPNVKKQN